GRHRRGRVEGAREVIVLDAVADEQRAAAATGLAVEERRRAGDVEVGVAEERGLERGDRVGLGAVEGAGLGGGRGDRGAAAGPPKDGGWGGGGGWGRAGRRPRARACR